jgi:hypothetical protein
MMLNTSSLEKDYVLQCHCQDGLGFDTINLFEFCIPTFEDHMKRETRNKPVYQLIDETNKTLERQEENSGRFKKYLRFRLLVVINTALSDTET